LDFDRQSFLTDLSAWYGAARRKLPWRETTDPYAILVSELMLQQTQVQTVIPYYRRFLAAFPTPRALAGAPEEAVLKLWEGLGYYRRARHLQEAARQIMDEHGGRFPDTKVAIDALKGVGPYTSAAVASIAFGLPWACLDGNVMRVLTRLFALDDDISLAATKQRLQDLAQSLVPRENPGDFNQAMMELGATVCTPREPACLSCPVNSSCAGYRAGDDPVTRPYKSKKVVFSRIAFEALFLFAGKRFLVCRRPDQGLMGGMWELPAQAADGASDWRRLFRGEIRPHGRLSEAVSHRFTHLHATWRIDAYSCPQPLDWISEPNGYAASRWVTAAELATLPLTRVTTRLMPRIADIIEGGLPCLAEPSGLPLMPTTS